VRKASKRVDMMAEMTAELKDVHMAGNSVIMMAAK